MRHSKHLNTLALLIGNATETYDLSIYPLFSAYLMKVFFPEQSDFVSLINIFSIFLFGYMVRPIGGLIFGQMGDIYGRRKALISSSLLMLIATGMIGITPSYQSIGYVSGFLLLILRMLQGLSFGGEYTGSVVYLVEHAAKDKRNTYGSIAAMGSNLGILLASLTCLIVMLNVSQEKILEGWWRTPFILSLLLSLICLTLRTSIEEPSSFKQLLSTNIIDRRPLLKVLSTQKSELLLIVVLTWFGVVTTYSLFVYFVPYLVTILHYQPHTALVLNAASLGLLVSIIPFAGKLADRYLKNRIIPISVISLATLIIPYLYFLSTTHYYVITFLQIIIIIPAAFYFATVPTYIVEFIQTSIRCRTFALGYNIAAAIFGGTTPFIVLSLVQKTNLHFIPGIYLLFCAIITLITLKMPFQQREDGF